MYIVGKYKGFFYTKSACMSFGNIMYSLKVVEQNMYIKLTQ